MRQIDRSTFVVIASLFGLWLAAFAFYVGFGGSPILPLMSFLVFGVALTSLVLILTRHVVVSDLSIMRPHRQLAVAALMVATFALLILGFVFSWVRGNIEPERSQELVIMALKVCTMIALPLSLMSASERRLSFKLRDGLTLRRVVLSLVLLGGVALLVSSVATDLASGLRTAAPTRVAVVCGVLGTLFWVGIGAAFAEEVLFRAYLQTRLMAVLKKEWLSIAFSTITFALVHVPGLYLRADQVDLMNNGAPPLPQCIAYSLAVLAPPGILFGMLWSRTKYLPLLIAVHALINLPPNLPWFINLFC